MLKSVMHKIPRRANLWLAMHIGCISNWEQGAAKTSLAMHIGCISNWERSAGRTTRR